MAQSLATYYVPYFSQMGIDVSGILNRPEHQPEGSERDKIGMWTEAEMSIAAGGMRGIGTLEGEVLAPGSKENKIVLFIEIHRNV